MLAAASAVHAKHLQLSNERAASRAEAVGEQREKQQGRIHELENPSGKGLPRDGGESPEF